MFRSAGAMRTGSGGQRNSRKTAQQDVSQCPSHDHRNLSISSNVSAVATVMVAPLCGAVVLSPGPYVRPGESECPLPFCSRQQGGPYVDARAFAGDSRAARTDG